MRLRRAAAAPRPARAPAARGAGAPFPPAGWTRAGRIAEARRQATRCAPRARRARRARPPALVDEVGDLVRSSRSGATRSSTIELGLAAGGAFGSSSASMPASENGWIGSRRWPITSAGASNVRRSAAVRRDAAEEQALHHARRSARGPGGPCRAGRRRQGTPPAGHRRAPRRTARITGSPNVSATSSGVKASAQPSSALSSTGISIDHAAHALRRGDGRLERRVRAQRGAADDRLVDLEVVEQRHDLLAEDGHRVAPHVARAVRVAVAEQVERDHAVAALGQRCARAARASAGCSSRPWSSTQRAAPRRSPCTRGAALVGEALRRARSALIFVAMRTTFQPSPGSCVTCMIPALLRAGRLRR